MKTTGFVTLLKNFQLPRVILIFFSSKHKTIIQSTMLKITSQKPKPTFSNIKKYLDMYFHQNENLIYSAIARFYDLASNGRLFLDKNPEMKNSLAIITFAKVIT